MADKKIIKKSIRKQDPFILFWIVSSLFVGILLGYELAVNQQVVSEYSQSGETIEANQLPQNIELCFTPPKGCSAVIVKAINQATQNIYVQAYGLTSPPIVDALIAAHQRGVKVRILLDKSNLTDRWSKMHQLASVGIEVAIDRVSGIAHNKIIILDQNKVITGSFNFTRAAEMRNAENVIIIQDQAVAKSYIQNWLSRRVKA